MRLGDFIPSINNWINQNNNHSFNLFRLKLSQITQDKNIILNDMLSLSSYFPDGYVENYKILVKNNLSKLDAVNLKVLYQKILSVLQQEADNPNFAWSIFLNKISEGARLLTLNQTKQQDISENYEVGEREIDENLLRAMERYIAENFKLSNDGIIIGLKKNDISTPPVEVVDNIIYFNKIINNRAINGAIANQITILVSDAINETSNVDKLDYEIKQEKYKDVPVVVRGRRGRKPNGELIDNIIGYTPQGRSFSSSQLYEDTKGILTSTNQDADVEEALHDALFRAFGPNEQIYKTQNGLVRLDYKDGRIGFYLTYPEAILEAGQKNGVNINSIIETQFNKTADRSNSALSLVDFNSNEVYEFLLKEYGSVLFEYLEELIANNDSRVRNWAIINARQKLSSEVIKRQRSKNIIQDGHGGGGNEGRQYEIRNKGKASDYAIGDYNEEAENLRSYFTSVLSEVKEIAGEIGDYYKGRYDLAKADMLQALVDSSAERVSQIIQPENRKMKEDLNAAGVAYRIRNKDIELAPGDITSFNKFVKPKDIFKKLEEKGRQRLEMKLEAQDMLSKNMTKEQIANELGIDAIDLDSLLAVNSDYIKNRYFLPNENDARESMKQLGELMLGLVEYIAKHPNLDPNPTGSDNIDEIALSKVKAIRTEYNVPKMFTNKDLIKLLSGISIPQNAMRRREEIARNYIRAENLELVKEFLAGMMKRRRNQIIERIGDNFTDWADLIVDISKRRIQDGKSTFPINVFMDFVRVHSNFKTPNEKTQNYSLKSVPKFYKALGVPVPDEYADVLRKRNVSVSYAKSRVAYAEVMSMLQKISLLSSVKNNIVKIAGVKTDIIAEMVDICNYTMGIIKRLK